MPAHLRAVLTGRDAGDPGDRGQAGAGHLAGVCLTEIAGPLVPARSRSIFPVSDARGYASAHDETESDE